MDRNLIDDSTLPITTYNNAAIRDRLATRRVTVSLPTIIARAKSLGATSLIPKRRHTAVRWF